MAQCIDIRDKERVFSIINRLSLKWALNPADWALYHNGGRLDGARLFEYYNIEPYTILALRSAIVDRPAAASAPAETPRAQRELGSENNVTPMTEPQTEVGANTRTPDAQKTAWETLSAAAAALESAKLRKKDSETLVTKAKEDVQRANEALVQTELRVVRASEVVARAEQAMRMALEDMSSALGGNAAAQN